MRATLSDPTVKAVLSYDGTKTVERFEIAAGGDEAAALVAAAEASQSFIVTRQGGYSGAGTLANVSNSAFTPGTNPTVANEDYSAAFAALEPYYYNTIALDVDDDSNMTLSLLLQSYLDSAWASWASPWWVKRPRFPLRPGASTPKHTMTPRWYIWAAAGIQWPASGTA